MHPFMHACILSSICSFDCWFVMCSPLEPSNQQPPRLLVCPRPDVTKACLRAVTYGTSCLSSMSPWVCLQTAGTTFKTHGAETACAIRDRSQVWRQCSSTSDPLLKHMLCDCTSRLLKTWLYMHCQLALDLSTAGMGCRALRLRGSDLYCTHQMPVG